MRRGRADPAKNCRAPFCTVSPLNLPPLSPWVRARHKTSTRAVPSNGRVQSMGAGLLRAREMKFVLYLWYN
eukprot:3599444-Rhodomonas_salina.2